MDEQTVAVRLGQLRDELRQDSGDLTARYVAKMRAQRAEQPQRSNPAAEEDLVGLRLAPSVDLTARYLARVAASERSRLLHHSSLAVTGQLRDELRHDGVDLTARYLAQVRAAEGAGRPACSG